MCRQPVLPIAAALTCVSRGSGRHTDTGLVGLQLLNEAEQGHAPHPHDAQYVGSA